MLAGTVFGQEIENRNEALDLGVQVIRFDVPHDTTENPNWIRDTLARMVGGGIKPWPVFHHTEHVQPVMEYAVSVGGDDFVLPSIFNEPDLGHDSLAAEFPPQGHIPPEIYIERVHRFRDICRSVGHTGMVLAGGISNLNGRGFKFLERTAPHLPPDCGQEIHLYPGAYQNPVIPNEGEGGTHPQALARVKRLIGDRRGAVGEFGFNQGPRDPFPRLTEDDLYRNYIQWFQMFDHAGWIDACCAYQWRDGDTTDAMGTYGIHKLNGDRKKSAYAIKDWRTA